MQQFFEQIHHVLLGEAL